METAFKGIFFKIRHEGLTRVKRIYLHLIYSTLIVNQVCDHYVCSYSIVMLMCAQEDKPLGINFCMSDVKSCNMDDLPAILHHDDNLKQVKRLLEAWKR